MKKTFRAIGAAILIIIISLAAVYLLLGRYYSTGFSCSTWINGVYCTGKSVEEVNKELIEKNIYPGISIYGPDDKTLFIGASEIDLKFDYTKSLEKILNEQNPYAWGLNIFKNLSATYDPTVVYDEDKLRGIVASWDIFSYDDLKISIEKGEDGYYLYNGLTNIPNEENIINSVNEAVSKLDIYLDITCFEDNFMDIPLTEEDEETVRLFEKVNNLQNCGLSYNIVGKESFLGANVAGDFLLREEDLELAKGEKISKKDDYTGKFIISGEEKELPEEDTLTVKCGFVLDENKNPIISESKMHEYFSKLSSEHDTKWLMEQYRKGNTSEIAISDNKKGNGSLFDIDSAFNVLKESYLNGSFSETQTYALKLNKEVKIYDAVEDLGNTYIEVNMKDQMLYYYVEGQLNMDMPIVTGNVNRSRGTPTGIFNVYNKRYHTYLRGVDYVSYVNYWLGVNKGVGIHDANWRSEFGEEIYKRDGSHGCINCPEEKVSKLWEVVDVGTPVVLYY